MKVGRGTEGVSPPPRPLLEWYMFKCPPVTHFLGLQPDLRLASSPSAGSCGMEGMDVEGQKKGPRD